MASKIPGCVTDTAAAGPASNATAVSEHPSQPGRVNSAASELPEQRDLSTGQLRRRASEAVLHPPDMPAPGATEKRDRGQESVRQDAAAVVRQRASHHP